MPRDRPDAGRIDFRSEVPCCFNTSPKRNDGKHAKGGVGLAPVCLDLKDLYTTNPNPFQKPHGLQLCDMNHVPDLFASMASRKKSGATLSPLRKHRTVLKWKIVKFLWTEISTAGNNRLIPRVDGSRGSAGWRKGTWMCSKLTVLQKKKSPPNLYLNYQQTSPNITIGLSSYIQVGLLVLSLAALHNWMTTEF